MPQDFDGEPAPTWNRSGKFRLRPEGSQVILQIEEFRMMGRWSKAHRWRDATPQDVMDRVMVELGAGLIPVGA